MLDCTMAYGLSFLFPAGDTTVARSLRDHGEFARVELDLLLQYAGESGNFIDVGANLGAISLPFAAARRRWFVFAIEAQRPLSGVLAANVLNNRLYNVEVYNAAAGAAQGVAQFPVVGLASRGNLGTIRFGMDAETEAVRMLTLDNLAPAETGLVKIDVEGYELEVLKGAQGLLARRETVWIAETADKEPGKRAELIAAFQAAGYAVHWFYAPFATPRAPKGAPANPVFGDVSVVALPPGAPNVWNLTPVAAPDEARPIPLSAYPYLGRYGY